jgi:nucleoside-diphosphate-sugar epimerase
VGRGHTASFIYVEDCARAITLAATVDSPSGRAYFVEDGHVYDQAQLMRCIGDAVGTRPRVIRVPKWFLMSVGALSELWGFVTRRATPINRDKIRDVCQRHWVCSSARTRTELGWAPTVTLAEGTRLTAAGYREAGWLR